MPEKKTYLLVLLRISRTGRKTPSKCSSNKHAKIFDSILNFYKALFSFYTRVVKEMRSEGSTQLDRINNRHVVSGNSISSVKTQVPHKLVFLKELLRYIGYL